MDDTTYKYLGFEMKKGEVERKEMMVKLEERIHEKLEQPTKMVETFEARNWIHFINQNVMSLIRFYSGPVKFTLGWLDRIDTMIRQHLTKQGMLMKRGMATSRLYTSPEDMGMGLEELCWCSCSNWSASSDTNGEPSSGMNRSRGWKSSPRKMGKEFGCERSKRY